jgi:hypothetical protein
MLDPEAKSIVPSERGNYRTMSAAATVRPRVANAGATLRSVGNDRKGVVALPGIEPGFED